MSFIISGDIHGTLDFGKIVKFFDEHEGEYHDDDYLIICGDVAHVDFLAQKKELQEMYLGIYLLQHFLLMETMRTLNS